MDEVCVSLGESSQKARSGSWFETLRIFAVLALQVELTHVQVSFSVSFPRFVVSNMFYFPYSYGHLPVISG